MHLLPLKFHAIEDAKILFTDDCGRAFIANSEFLERYVTNRLTPNDFEFLGSQGMAWPSGSSLQRVSSVRALASRIHLPSKLNYFLLVPTLRCDLGCRYCQVSRANENATGYDWDESTLELAWRFIKANGDKNIQVEFQGGEPFLRPDLLQEVIRRCEEEFDSCRFIICTNLSLLNKKIRTLIANPNVLISTSLDGPYTTHKKNRTISSQTTDVFWGNLKEIIHEFGSSKVSALPTIDYHDPPEHRDLIATYCDFGLHSIYLRPVNYQGFARKRFRDIRQDALGWNEYYSEFVEELIGWNSEATDLVEEYYLSLILRRCLRASEDNHVDLRNPNPYGMDYLVIDYDGRLYPTDESRMMTRSGVVDLSIGDLAGGVYNRSQLELLNANCFNNFDSDCIHCAFQPACGVDIVDDLSRYGRRDIPRHQTFFCQRQTKAFEMAWKLLLAPDQEIRRSVCHWLDIPYTERELVPRHD